MATIILTTFLTGILFGVFRYWVGFFVLGHAFFAPLAAMWLASRFYTASEPFRMRDGLLVITVLLIGEMLGFGLSQPWFDPHGWFLRVLDGDTAEHIFGIALIGGAVGRDFAMGVEGGWWAFFNLLDLFFLFLFTMFGLNSFVYREKR
ncbi:hypothetical protein [Hydrogenimonas sp.]|uniref:hypothetical protein n=1 Tax=Hydrogenimonas sp. TaxID=2231112 RepID=UPI00263881DF|nr:hypothetical protein [Hydrogenimonas sp.]